MAPTAASPSNYHDCSDGWKTPYGEGDVHCRMCGKALIDLRIEPSQILVLLADNTQGDVPKIKLDNTSSVRSVRVKLKSSHPAVEFALPPQQQEEIEIPKEQPCELDICVNPAQLGRDRDWISADVEITILGTALPPRRIPIRVGRVPEFECEVQPFPKLQPRTRVHTTARLRQTVGVPTQLQEARFDHPAFSLAGLTPGEPFEKGRETTFQITFDSSQVAQYGKQTEKLTLKFEAGRPLEISIPVEVEKPPHLEIIPVGQPQIPQGIISESALSLRNVGGGTLEITSLEFPNRPKWFRTTILEFSEEDRRPAEELKPHLPIRVAANSAVKLHCEVDAETLPVGPCAVEVKAQYNGGQLEDHSLRLQVNEVEPYDHFVAIDFGTTNSCVAYCTDRFETKMVPFRDLHGKPQPVVPSVAFYDQTNDRWVAGFEALKMAERVGRPELLVHSVKRLMNVGKGGEGRQREVEIDRHPFEPEVVATAIFRYLRRQTERHLRHPLADVMISLPANFTDSGVQAVLRAVCDAGIRPFQPDNRDKWHSFRIDEPTAAAIEAAKCKKDHSGKERFVLVFDFGGGTLDVSVLLVDPRPDVRRIEVLAHKGDNWLGGDDLTASLMQIIVDKFRAEKGLDVPYKVEELKRTNKWYDLDSFDQIKVLLNHRLLWEAAETAKIDLSTKGQIEIGLNLSAGGKEHPFKTTIKRTEFEQHGEVPKLVSRAMEIIDRAIKRAQLKRPVKLEEIDEVIATGRTSLVPLVRTRLIAHCRRQDLDRYDGFEEKECVSRGACHYAVEKFEVLGSAEQAPLECVGLHEVTNCSYGYNLPKADDVAGEICFKALIPEGTPYGKGEVFKDPSGRVTQFGRADITIYQHTGDPEKDDLISPANRDIVPIDRINVKGVEISNYRKLPLVEVRMWVGQDGLLEAEAQVEGHSSPFRLQNRYRV